MRAKRDLFWFTELCEVASSNRFDFSEMMKECDNLVYEVVVLEADRMARNIDKYKTMYNVGPKTHFSHYQRKHYCKAKH